MSRLPYYFIRYKGFHPNAKPVKSPAKCMSYTKKDGNCLYIMKYGHLSNMEFDTYTRAVQLASSGDWMGATRLIYKEQPKETKFLDKFELNFKKIAAFEAKAVAVHRFLPQDFISTNLRWNKMKTLIVYGPSGYGKTQYVKTLFKNPLIVSHIDKLKKFCPVTHDGIAGILHPVYSMI